MKNDLFSCYRRVVTWVDAFPKFKVLCRLPLPRNSGRNKEDRKYVMFSELADRLGLYALSDKTDRKTVQRKNRTTYAYNFKNGIKLIWMNRSQIIIK